MNASLGDALFAKRKELRGMPLALVIIFGVILESYEMVSQEFCFYISQDYMLFDPLIYHGMAEMHDRHRDMRLDVDNMSYEVNLIN